MKFSGLIDKFKIIFDMITNSNVLMVLLILLVGTIILRLSNKINNKKMGIIIYLIEVIAFAVVFFMEKSTLITIGNDLIDNIFLNFYFPSVYVYLFIFVFSYTTFIYTLLNKFISKTYKIITNIYFLTFNFIFVLLVETIVKNDINIFAKESLFTNNNTLVLLELSTLLFFIYLVVNVLIYITNSIIVFVGEKKLSKIKNEDLVSNNIVLDNVVVNSNNDEVQIPDMPLAFDDLVANMENNNTKIDLVPEIKSFYSTSVSEELSLNTNEKFKFLDPVLLEEPVLKMDEEDLKEKLNFIDFSVLEKPKEESFTLNDYKLFSSMLKTVIQNSNNSNLSISDILNKTLLDSYSIEEYTKFEKILNSCLN